MPATALLTSDQFSAFPDEFDQNGNRIRQELISGELVEMPPSTQIHNLVKINVLELLLPFGLSNPHLGVRVLAEMAYVVSPNDIFVPDASVILRSRLSARKQKYITGAPDLAIGVVSRTDTAANLKAKVDAYIEGGSQTVWVIFPDSRSVVIHSADWVRDLKNDQLIEDPLLPGFSAPVSRFFDLT